MSFRHIPYLAAVAVFCATSLAAAQFPRSTGEIVAPAPKTNKHKPPARKAPEPPPQPEPPPRPPTLVQMPPVTPKVTFAGGQLMIDAPNSRLSDVLSAVHRATGADFDGPLSDERVAVRLGPGTPRDVIQALLHGSHYDYVIVGAETDPASVQRVLLMRPGGVPGQPGTVLTQGPPRPNVNPPPNPNMVDEADETTNTEEVPETTVPEPPPGNGNVNNGEIQNTQENNQNPPPKTPEQLLQELQQLQQQQIQQNNQQTQPPPE